MPTTPDPNSPAYLAAVRAGAPTRQNPQGSQIYQQAYGQSFANMLQQANQNPAFSGDDLFTKRPLNSTPAPTPTAPPTEESMWASIHAGQDANFQGWQSTNLPGGQVQYSSSGPPSTDNPGAGTNLSPYTTGPDQYDNPTPTPGLNYLGLPNYSNLSISGYGNNSDNGFAGLFGGNGQPGFLSGWS